MGNIEDINKELAKIAHELREYADSHPDSLAHEFIYGKVFPRRTMSEEKKRFYGSSLDHLNVLE